MRTDEVDESLRAHGRRYLERVYTEHEQQQSNANVRRLAECFAAKEATLKALGRRDEGLPWRSIELRVDGNSAPVLKLSGAAADLATQKGISALSVSLTQEGSLAAAVVLARCDRL